jgi:hypothetical protein
MMVAAFSSGSSATRNVSGFLANEVPGNSAAAIAAESIPVKTVLRSIGYSFKLLL